jgi:hypothetical protein
MTTLRHGLSIGIERVNNDFFLSLKAIGTLTHDDYNVITPMIDAAMQEVPTAKIKALFDVSEMHGWELRAAWDDFKLGLKHGSEFEKIAIYGHKHWQEIIANIGSWFISGEVEFFEDDQKAIEWLNE